MVATRRGRLLVPARSLRGPRCRRCGPSRRASPRDAATATRSAPRPSCRSGRDPRGGATCRARTGSPCATSSSPTRTASLRHGRTRRPPPGTTRQPTGGVRIRRDHPHRTPRARSACGGSAPPTATSSCTHQHPHAWSSRANRSATETPVSRRLRHRPRYPPRPTAPHEPDVRDVSRPQHQASARDSETTPPPPRPTPHDPCHHHLKGVPQSCPATSGDG